MLSINSKTRSLLCFVFAIYNPSGLNLGVNVQLSHHVIKEEKIHFLLIYFFCWLHPSFLLSQISLRHPRQTPPPFLNKNLCFISKFSTPGVVCMDAGGVDTICANIAKNMRTNITKTFLCNTIFFDNTSILSRHMFFYEIRLQPFFPKILFQRKIS